MIKSIAVGLDSIIGIGSIVGIVSAVSMSPYNWKLAFFCTTGLLLCILNLIGLLGD